MKNENTGGGCFCFDYMRKGRIRLNTKDRVPWKMIPSKIENIQAFSMKIVTIKHTLNVINPHNGILVVQEAPLP